MVLLCFFPNKVPGVGRMQVLYVFWLRVLQVQKVHLKSQDYIIKRLPHILTFSDLQQTASNFLYNSYQGNINTRFKEQLIFCRLLVANIKTTM
jgi:hypothetical protein